MMHFLHCANAVVAQWRAAQKKAKLAEIEQAVDEQMNRLRAQMIEEAAQGRWRSWQTRQAASERSQPRPQRTVATVL
jgi:hypothetical protein